MNKKCFNEDSSDESSIDIDSWTFLCGKRCKTKFEPCKPAHEVKIKCVDQILCSRETVKRSNLKQKFDDLRKKSLHVRQLSQIRQAKTDKKQLDRTLKKVLEDSAFNKAIKKSVEQGHSENLTNSVSKEQTCWQDIKPFLTVNKHLTGPVSHGNYGPKTELDQMIDNAIHEGDFHKAEMLSDHLSNRQFATKITQAFAAKRFAEEKKKESEQQKAQKLKKLNWGFEAKERWEMKGNM